MSAGEKTKALILVVAITFLGVIGYGLLRFDAAGGLDCDAPLRGADPREQFTEGFLVGREDKACSDKSTSRLTVGGIVGLLYLTVGIGAVLMPESGIERVIFGGEDPQDVFPGD